LGKKVGWETILHSRGSVRRKAEGVLVEIDGARIRGKGGGFALGLLTSIKDGGGRPATGRTKIDLTREEKENAVC